MKKGQFIDEQILAILIAPAERRELVRWAHADLPATQKGALGGCAASPVARHPNPPCHNATNPPLVGR